MASQPATRRCGALRTPAELAAGRRGEFAADVQVIGLLRDTHRVLEQFERVEEEQGPPAHERMLTR